MNNKIKMEGDKVISIEPFGRNLAPHTSMAPIIITRSWCILIIVSILDNIVT